MKTSRRLKAAREILTTISPAPATGSAISSTCSYSGPPSSLSRTAFIDADAYAARIRSPGDEVKQARLANARFVLIDHIDLRVADVAAARPFYDAFLKAFGFRAQRQANGDIVYYRVGERRVQEAIALIESASHVANEARLAFHAASPEDVDRLASVALGAGARAYEAPQWCPEIARDYYAAFFEDPSGNRLEVVCR